MVAYLIYSAEQVRYEPPPGPVFHRHAEPWARPAPNLKKPRPYRRPWTATPAAWHARLRVPAVRTVED